MLEFETSFTPLPIHPAELSCLMAPLSSDPEIVNRKRVRTAFVSDIHVGSRYCQAERFLSFLYEHDIDRLYIVGDFIDGWRLRRKWHWPKVYHRIFHRLLQMQAAGTELYYTPGNHDEFLRNYLHDFGIVNVADEFVHKAEDGRQFLVMHGDRFDDVEQSFQWLSVFGASMYEFLMWTNYATNCVRHALGFSEWHYAGAVKMKFKGAVNFISDFESRIAQYARGRDCDAVICGHIHAPTVQKIGDVTYCNTGDWVEHCTAIVEHTDGSWELTRHFMKPVHSVVTNTPRQTQGLPTTTKPARSKSKSPHRKHREKVAT